MLLLQPVTRTVGRSLWAFEAESKPQRWIILRRGKPAAAHPAPARREGGARLAGELGRVETSRSHEKVLEVGKGDGGTIMQMYLMPLDHS